MTRPARNRLLVLAFWTTCLVGGYRLPREVLAPVVGAMAVALALSWWVARDFFGARRAMRRKDWVDALQRFERFEQAVTHSPGRRRLSFLAAGIYTFDPVAITRNNVGVVHLENGSWDLAEASLRAAVQRDGLYAVPHLNLAVVAARRRDVPAVEAHLAQARRLGLSSKRAHAKVKALVAAPGVP